MRNEPKRPNVKEYKSEQWGEYLHDMQKYADRLESELERLKEELRMIEFQESHGVEVIRNIQSDLARCKSERLGAEEIREYITFTIKKWTEGGANNYIIHNQDSITAFRASQQTEDKTNQNEAG